MKNKGSIRIGKMKLLEQTPDSVPFLQFNYLKTALDGHKTRCINLQVITVVVFAASTLSQVGMFTRCTPILTTPLVGGGNVGECYTLNGNAVKVTSVRNKHADFSWTPWRAVSTAIWKRKNGVEITAQYNDLDNLRGFTTECFCHLYRVMFRLHQAGMYRSLPAILKITPNNRFTV